MLVVAVYFRSVGAPLVTLLTAAAAYIVAVRVVAGSGDAIGVSVPQEIEPLLVVLLLGLVTTTRSSSCPRAAGGSCAARRGSKRRAAPQRA
jgi:hypothetical protein